MKIAVLYMAIGRYSIYWKGFYKSCEKNFMPNVERHYYFFTDSNDIEIDKDKVTIVNQENLGWPLVACHWYKILNRLKEEYKNYDYVFFFQSNIRFIKKITPEEFLPKDNEKIIAVLSSANKHNKNADLLDFSRDENSQAYIPYGTNIKYFHSGILGGKTNEFISLLDECEKMTDIDLAKDIIPCRHDESIFNKYLLNHQFKELSNNYLFPVEGKPFWKLFPVKIIQAPKTYKEGGRDWLRGITDKKQTYFDYLMEKLGINKR